MQSIVNRKLIVSLLALAAVALLVVALSATSDSTTSDSGQAGDSEPALAATSGGTASQFSVLKPAASVPKGEIPDAVASVLDELPGSGGQGNGVVTALGIVPGGSGSSQAVVAEVSGSLCVFAAGKDYQGAAVGSCFTITKAEAGEAYVAVQGTSPDEVRVIGIVPDGVKDVSFDSGANGTVDAKAPVQSNVYQADVAKAPTAVTGRGASGDARFQANLPLAANGG
jgi:hypothetical protein